MREAEKTQAEEFFVNNKSYQQQDNTYRYDHVNFPHTKKFWRGCNEISETVKIGGIIYIYGLVWPEVTRSRWSEQLTQVWFGFDVNFLRG